MTLLEVIMAMMIFSIGILAVLSMQSNGMRGTARTRQDLNDTAAMVKQVELLLALDYNNHELVDGDLRFDSQHPDHGPVAIPGSMATLEWEVADDSPVTGTKRIQVFLRRPGPGPPIDAISLLCLKAGDGPGLE